MGRGHASATERRAVLHQRLSSGASMPCAVECLFLERIVNGSEKSDAPGSDPPMRPADGVPSASGPGICGAISCANGNRWYRSF
jgi:hypothetical protein